MEYLTIRDPSKDTDRKFAVKPLTRSIAQRMDDLDLQQMELAQGVLRGLDLPDGETPATDEQREAVLEASKRTAGIRDEQVRLQCEAIGLLTHATEGGQRADELLQSRWDGDTLTEDELDHLFAQAQEKAKKRPR